MKLVRDYDFLLSRYDLPRFRSFFMSPVRLTVITGVNRETRRTINEQGKYSKSNLRNENGTFIVDI